jgi:hypothetical protein
VLRRAAEPQLLARRRREAGVLASARHVGRHDGRTELGKKPHAKAALRPDGSLELCPPAGSPGSSRSSLIIVTGENPVTIGLLDRVTKKLVKLDPPRCPR